MNLKNTKHFLSLTLIFAFIFYVQTWAVTSSRKLSPFHKMIQNEHISSTSFTGKDCFIEIKRLDSFNQPIGFQSTQPSWKYQVIFQSSKLQKIIDMDYTQVILTAKELNDWRLVENRKNSVLFHYKKFSKKSWTRKGYIRLHFNESGDISSASLFERYNPELMFKPTFLHCAFYQ